VRSLLALSLLAALALPASAAADSSTGGTAPGSVPVQQEGAQTGGTAVGDVVAPAPAPRHHSRRSRGRAPLVTSFAIHPGSIFIYGRSARVSFEVTGRSRSVRLRLLVLRPGAKRPLRAIDLGTRPTNTVQTVRVNGREGGSLPQGTFELRLAGRDSAGRRVRAGAQASGVQRLQFHWHRFPLIGQFTYGLSPDGRFGAPRPGHAHQGQDIPAPEGTPVVAPRGGVVKFIGHQAEGAGNYVVLHGEGEDLDFAFMHLKDGSITVKQGERVATGRRLGLVGTTGESSGPHLHFEIWKGDWFAGGRAIDPLPFLRRWDAWS
jgi:murein DD-endopeptidase MepM/ murein hydrolase activator NlpD